MLNQHSSIAFQISLSPYFARQIVEHLKAGREGEGGRERKREREGDSILSKKIKVKLIRK